MGEYYSLVNGKTLECCAFHHCTPGLRLACKLGSQFCVFLESSCCVLVRQPVGCFGGLVGAQRAETRCSTSVNEGSCRYMCQYCVRAGYSFKEIQ